MRRYAAGPDQCIDSAARQSVNCRISLYGIRQPEAPRCASILDWEHETVWRQAQQKLKTYDTEPFDNPPTSLPLQRQSRDAARQGKRHFVPAGTERVHPVWQHFVARPVRATSVSGAPSGDASRRGKGHFVPAGTERVQPVWQHLVARPSRGAGVKGDPAADTGSYARARRLVPKERRTVVEVWDG